MIDKDTIENVIIQAFPFIGHIEEQVGDISEEQFNEILRGVIAFFCSISETVYNVPEAELEKAVDNHPLFNIKNENLPQDT